MYRSKAIGNDADYEAALARIDELMGAERGTPEGEELDVLTDLVVNYDWENDSPSRMMLSDPDRSRSGIFVDHNCWRCEHGEKPCVSGHPNRCAYPHARND